MATARDPRPRAALAAVLGATLVAACSTAAPRPAPVLPPALPDPAPSRPQDANVWRDPFEDDVYPNMRVAAEGGLRTYRDDAWGKLDEQPVVGFSLTQEPPEWILGLEGGMYWSGTDGDLPTAADADVDTWEGIAGVMKSLPLLPDRLLLELGAGYSLGYVRADHDNGLERIKDEVWWSSAYGRAGLLLRLGDDAWCGLSLRSVRGGGGRLLGTQLDGDFDQLAFVLAARW